MGKNSDSRKITRDYRALNSKDNCLKSGQALITSDYYYSDTYGSNPLYPQKKRLSMICHTRESGYPVFC